MSLTFHPLKLKARTLAAEDAVCLTLEIPPALRSEYAFVPGQHLALRALLQGREVRRTYSIIDGTPGGTVRLGLRVQAASAMSHFLAQTLAVGDTVEAMTPAGRFRRTLHGGRRQYLALACGSGITPILSIVTSVLEQESDSRVLLLYGNRTSANAMFLEELLELKNRFLERFSMHCLMSREPQEMDVFNGRLDAAKIRELAGVLFDPAAVDEAFLCGPGDMVGAAREALTALGVRGPIHFERFTAGSGPPTAVSATGAAAGAAAPGAAGETRVTVTADGRRRRFTMRTGEGPILEAAERAGIELPFSCRSGVCSTCRVKVLRGSVTMANNVALEDWELAAGFVLCCQARPTTSHVELSYDEI
jgi:ring-1,2-phenylacetyl-CoA epoxidase subunit PaaE